MNETVAVVTEVDSPKILKKVFRNRKAAAVATVVVAAGLTFAATKFLKDSVDVEIVTDNTSA